MTNEPTEMENRPGILLKRAGLTVCFSVGFFCGWLVWGEKQIPDPKPPTEQRKVMGKRVRANIRDEKSNNATKHLEQARSLKDSEYREYLATIPATETSLMRDLLLSQAGAGGIGKKNIAILKELIQKWTKEYPEEAFTWAMSQEIDSTRRPMLEWILWELSTSNPTLALGNYREVRTSYPAMTVDIPPALMRHVVRQGAEAFLELLQLSPNAEKHATGFSLDFPPGFDFPKAADGIIAYKTERNGAHPRDFPSNFMQAWAMKEPLQAAQFLADHGQDALPFSRWRDVIRASTKSLGEEKTLRWFHDILLNEPESQALGRLTEAAWIGEDRFSKVFPDATERDQVILQNLRSGGWTFRESVHGDIITNLSAPGARLEALQALKISIEDIQDMGDYHLTKWKLTRDQIREQLLIEPRNDSRGGETP